MVFLIVLAVGFGIGLIVVNNKAREERQRDTAHITQLSNEVVQVRGQLNDQKTVNASLENNLNQLQTNLADVKAQAAALAGKLTETETTLRSTSETLEKTRAEARAASESAAAEMAKRDARIRELEGENDDLTKKMIDLNTSLGNLEKQIAETERKLAASEGDREFLLRELRRLQAEKAELEKQFNDLAVLREQVRRLKEELSIARRLEWIRRGIYGAQGQKGAEALVRPSTPARAESASPDLEVEIKQSGDVTIQGGTNAPAPRQ